MLFLRALPVSQRNMRFWPTTPTSFRVTMDEYPFQMHKVCMTLFGLMGANLGVDPEKLCSIYQDGVQGIGMNYYPPWQQADKVIGLTPQVTCLIAPHSDGGLTLLVQVSKVEGLQIKKNNRCVLT
ncbi:unnamed protein product [Coffea canephora]|uniref:Isopenicillin N synthase-like Fe(2+) 2OG dioxygenase domain-containing protein n=1 Tax=Coffea canephora TaxID=49390 RepID=A0A068UX24_COFCA|nr:unnamed protein product [Coffea canephora]